MSKKINIIWFKKDLRISDNPIVEYSYNQGTEILAIYILDPIIDKSYKLGLGSKAWLFGSLNILNKSLDNKLNIYQGKSEHIISKLIKEYQVSNILYNKSYDIIDLEDEKQIKQICNSFSIGFKSFNSNYLFHPQDLKKDDGGYYKVFTAYKKKSYTKSPRKVISNNKIGNLIIDKNAIDISDLNLVDNNNNFQNLVLKKWSIGEFAAQKKLASFVKDKLSGYKKGRDYPSLEQTSYLSPHLHFGEISPSQIWEYVNKQKNIHESDKEHFLSELLWREFSTYLLYYFPSLKLDNFNKKFDNFPWKNNKKYLDAWKIGKTGYPIIDAGMRELLETGYMHNRVRMLVASFLVKNLQIHWHKGEEWFWQYLVDADLANNSASWQWVAGSGVDAAPYFRIFNPTTQAEKFDSEGTYIKKYVPELSKMPKKYLFEPWNAPANILLYCGIELGKNYPYPIIDLSDSRKKALEAYRNL